MYACVNWDVDEVDELDYLPNRNKMLVNREVKIGLLTKYEKEYVTFKILEKGDVVDLILTLDQLMFHDSYSLVKMKPDYENGVFSNE